MEKILAANLKMNLTNDEIKEYIKNIEGKMNSDKVIICPPNIYLKDFVGKDFKVGSQDAFYIDKGAYTGEVSAAQIKSIGVDYSIIGHSERRQYFGETDEIVNRKASICINHGLGVIICIGETGMQKSNDETKSILESQLRKDLENITDMKNVIIAYEPIWAIGTGVVPTMDEIKETIDFIKDITFKITNSDMPVLYGGSVNEKNIESINDIDCVSGVLVGGASLDTNKLMILKDIVVK